MSPQLVLGLPYTAKIDSWALGVIIFILTVGKSPFSGNSFDDLFSNIVYKSI